MGMDVGWRGADGVEHEATRGDGVHTVARTLFAAAAEQAKQNHGDGTWTRTPASAMRGRLPAAIGRLHESLYEHETLGQRIDLENEVRRFVEEAERQEGLDGRPLEIRIDY